MTSTYRMNKAIGYIETPWAMQRHYRRVNGYTLLGRLRRILSLAL